MTVILSAMAFPLLMSALLVLSHAAAPPSDPERCRAAVSEAQALLAGVEADPDSYENVEETRASLRRTIAEARCAAPTPPEAVRPSSAAIDDPGPRHEAAQARLRPVPGDSARGPASPRKPVPSDPRKGLPTGAMPLAAGLLLALGGLAWSIKGRAAAEGSWRNVKQAIAVAAMVLGVLGAGFGGCLMLVGASAATPALALVGGGALAPAVALEGAVMAEGAALTAGGLGLAGYSYAKSQPDDASPEKPSSAGGRGALNGLRRPTAQDPELKAIVDRLFKPGVRLPGGTAGALRHEAATGRLLSRAGHAQKAREHLRTLNHLLKEGRLDPADRAAAEALRADLQHALNAWSASRTP